MATFKQQIKELEEHLGISLKSPSFDENFTRYWNIYIYDLASRDNFKPSHLLQLQILVEMHVEMDVLRDYIAKHGSSFTAFSRNGEETERPRPEVQLLLRNRVQIKDYLRMMGLLLTKDKIMNKSRDEAVFI